MGFECFEARVVLSQTWCVGVARGALDVAGRREAGAGGEEGTAAAPPALRAGRPRFAPQLRRAERSDDVVRAWCRGVLQ